MGLYLVGEADRCGQLSLRTGDEAGSLAFGEG